MKFSTLLLGGFIGALSSSIYIIERYERPLENRLKNREKQLDQSLRNTEDAIVVAKYWRSMYETLQNSLRKDETES